LHQLTIIAGRRYGFSAARSRAPHGRAAYGMSVDQRERALVKVVDDLEAELRRMRLWEREPPSEASLASTKPFCIDTLELSQWLQWLLIPRMRNIFAGYGDLPTRSAIYPLAEDCFEHLEDPTRLLMLIERFDRLIGGDAGALMH
jgi:uncharacterized protein YqcC (DUF446 family)